MAKYKTKAECEKAVKENLIGHIGAGSGLINDLTLLLCEACEIDTRTVGEKIAEKMLVDGPTKCFPRKSLAGGVLLNLEESVRFKTQLASLIDAELAKKDNA